MLLSSFIFLSFFRTYSCGFVLFFFVRVYVHTRVPWMHSWYCSLQVISDGIPQLNGTVPLCTGTGTAVHI